MLRLEALKEICSRHGVGAVYLFGSMAESAHRLLLGEEVSWDDPLADVDVGLVFLDPSVLTEAGRRLELYVKLHNALSDFFPAGRLDLVFLQQTHSVFQAQAIATGYCIYTASPEFREAYEERVLAKAADFRFVLERYYAERLEEVRLEH